MCVVMFDWFLVCFFFKQKTAYEMRISDWSSDVCSSDLPGGLADYLKEQVGDRPCATADFFSGAQDFPDDQGRVEWAIGWPLYSDGSYSWYCNTIPTPDGGTHEAGLRAALVRALRAFGDLTGQKKAKDLSADDVLTEIGRAHV